MYMYVLYDLGNVVEYSLLTSVMHVVDTVFRSTVVCTTICGLILVLNASLRGKFAYRFENSFSVWFFLYNVVR